MIRYDTEGNMSTLIGSLFVLIPMLFCTFDLVRILICTILVLI